MKDFSKTHLTFLVLFLIVGLAGGYFWYWSVQHLQTETRTKASLQSQIVQVEKKGLPPTQAVLSKLEENQKAFTDLSLKSLEEVKQTVGLFDSVVLKQEAGKLPQGLPSDAWKNLMNKNRAALDKLAAANKVQLPKDPYYGFIRYKVSNPEDKFTGQLGIQLLGLNEISAILIESKVKSIISTKRVYIEDSTKTAGPSGGGDESIQASILSGPENLYQIYPFEVVVKCSTAELRDLINRINQSKYFFVIRFMMVENEKANVESRTAIQAKMATAATGQLMVPVAGNEYLNVRLRIDMLVWTKAIFATEGAPEAQGAAR